jgi:hypothetical protein
MAIWQFDVYFIPRSSLIERYGHIPAQLEIKTMAWEDYFNDFKLDEEPDFEDAMTINWWQGLNVDFDEILPALEEFGEVVEWTSQSNGLRQFGNNDTDDISVGFDPITSKVESLHCRLDVRQIDKAFADKACSLARRFDCLFMDRQAWLYEPTIDKLAERIQLSNAYRFAVDPRQFFDDLSKGIIKPE